MAVDTHFHPLKVRSVRPETDEAMVVSFDIPDELGERFRFTQGQYLTLRQRIAGEEVRRSYSICAGIDDGELRVGVRRVRGGRFSNWLAENLRAGDTIDVMPPQGRFFVPIEPAAARNYLCVAGGSGITPMISIMKTVLANEPGSRVTLVYGNRRAASTMFKEELEDLKNRYVTRVSLHHVFSEERVDSPLNQGVLDRAKLGEFLQHLIVGRPHRPRVHLRPVHDERRGRGRAAGRGRRGGTHPRRTLRRADPRRHAAWACRPRRRRRRRRATRRTASSPWCATASRTRSTTARATTTCSTPAPARSSCSGVSVKISLLPVFLMAASASSLSWAEALLPNAVASFIAWDN